MPIQTSRDKPGIRRRDGLPDWNHSKNMTMAEWPRSTEYDLGLHKASIYSSVVCSRFFCLFEKPCLPFGQVIVVKCTYLHKHHVSLRYIFWFLQFVPSCFFCTKLVHTHTHECHEWSSSCFRFGMYTIPRMPSWLLQSITYRKDKITRLFCWVTRFW